MMSLKQEDLRLISTVLEIAYRCLLAGSVNFGSNTVTYLNLLIVELGAEAPQGVICFCCGSCENI